MGNRIQLRRDTAANWTVANPVLLEGEIGYEKDTGSLKFGNGVDDWSGLSYNFPVLDSLGRLVGPIYLFNGTTAEIGGYIPDHGIAVWNKTTEELAIGNNSAIGGVPVTALASGEGRFVVKAGTSPIDNAARLAAAIIAANAVVNVNGSAKSATNRVVIILTPGLYDTSSTGVTLSSPYVDLAGISQEGCVLIGTGQVLKQTTANVRISELTVICTGTPTLANTSSDPAAYAPNTGLSNTFVTNCRFEGTWAGGTTGTLPTRSYITYAGVYQNIRTVGQGAWGAVTGTTPIVDGSVGTTAVARFINCISDAKGFAYKAVCNGYFHFCGGGTNLTAPITLEDMFGGAGGTASGNFFHCTVGSYSFGASGIFSGRANLCFAGHGGFGAGGTMSGQMNHCVIRRGTSGTAAGVGLVTGIMNRCDIMLGSNTAAPASIGANGQIYNCSLFSGGTYSIDAPSAVNAKVANCTLTLPIHANMTNLIASPNNLINSALTGI